MNRVSSEILKYIREKNLVKEGCTVYLAVSGGADSVAMALIFTELSKILKCNLFIMNIEHGIRGVESKEDSDFVLDFASKIRVPAASIPIDSVGFSKENGMTLEEGARVLRYRTMADFILSREHSKTEQAQTTQSSLVETNINMNKTDAISFSASENDDAGEKSLGENIVLATAHHASDSVETMLFNMARGTGLKGLSGIRPETEINGIRVIRPILPLTREDIESYLDEKGYSFRHDSTNDDDDISRNYIRHVIIPSFSKLNSRAVSNIFECSEKVLEASDYFSRTAEKAVTENRKLSGNDLRFDVSLLFSYDQVLRPYIIFEWLRQNLISVKDISDSHIHSILSIAETSQKSASKKETDLPQNVTVCCENGFLSLSRKNNDTVQDVPQKISSAGIYTCANTESVNLEKDSINEPVSVDFGNGRFTFRVFEKEQSEDFPRKNYTKWLDYDKISNAISVRYRKSGDLIQTILGSESIPLRRFFINEKIPREDRDSVPLLCDGSEVLWAVGLRLSEKAKITERTKKVLAVNYIRFEDL